jgi:hypothetical protein
VTVQDSTRVSEVMKLLCILIVAVTQISMCTEIHRVKKKISENIVKVAYYAHAYTLYSVLQSIQKTDPKDLPYSFFKQTCRQFPTFFIYK